MTDDLNWEMLVNTPQGKDHALEVLSKMWDAHHYLQIEIKAGKAVSEKQFGSLHLWCQWVADTLNDAGLDQAKVLSKKSLPVPWTKEAVKTSLYKPVLAALSNKDSTKDQDRTEPKQVEEVLARWVATEFGLTLPPWPKKKDEI